MEPEKTMLFGNIRADIEHKRSWFYQEAGWWKKLLVLVQPGTLVVIVYRFGHWAYKLKNPILRNLLMLIYWATNLFVVICTQSYIRHETEIGQGLVIHNWSGVFIANATMGENCIVYQGVAVGHLRHFRGPGRSKGRAAPRIGNNVYIASGAKVLGDVVIGDNVVVGANSLVITSVPDNCTVLGVPARIIARNNRWIAEKRHLAQADKLGQDRVETVGERSVSEPKEIA
ncbi:MAG: serine O-acetyltransferase [Gammaproteobacteria bacterium]